MTRAPSERATTINERAFTIDLAFFDGTLTASGYAAVLYFPILMSQSMSE